MSSYRNFTILDWSPAFFTKDNGLPVNAQFGNCLVTRDRKLLAKSDAVVIEVRGIAHIKDMPQHREPWQRWVYFNIESPYFAILDYKGNYVMDDFKQKLAFNWTMTYRTDSDVPMLHGWIVKKTPQEQEKDPDIAALVTGKSKLVAALVSNCFYVRNGRGAYMKELAKHMNVEVYGSCGTFKCDGHYTKHACEKVGQYKFFLAFENSNCRDYISFKMWMQGFGNKAVPVVLGTYKEDYVKQAPPGSFIHADDFESPKELAAYLLKLDKDDAAYSKFHEWRKTYKIEYDYRFLGSFAWHSVCSALNRRYKEPPRWHKKITDFENVAKDCYLNKWVNKTCGGKTCL